MSDKQIEIFRKRLDATETQIANYLDQDLHRIGFNKDGQIDNQPDLGLFKSEIVYLRGAKPVDLLKIESPKESIVYLWTFWEKNRRTTLGVIYSGNGPFARLEFCSGYIEINRVHIKNDKPTEVIVISDWPTLRSYWEWVAKRLANTFQERRKGGPRETPLQKRIAVVLGWRNVIGKMHQDYYCNHNPQGVVISTRMLQKWEKDLEARGIIPKRNR